MHLDNCFLTLTYSDSELPKSGSLEYRVFQLFMKRVRKHFHPATVRFYMCGEYGDMRERPHYHALLFGVDFKDRVYWSTSPSGEKLYRSPTLEKLWPHGHSLIGNVTFESAAYVARYIMKKVTGDNADAHYSKTDPETGEIVRRLPEFTRMSLKPGVGKGWVDKYRDDVYPHDYVVVRGKKSRPPRYYDKALDQVDPEALEAIKFERGLAGRVHADDQTPERLAVRETVAKAGVALFSRRID